MNKQGADSLRILQYNILAESYAPVSWFPHVAPPVLSWQSRSWALLRHIVAYDADVICLQEVDHFADFFQPELTSLGYTGTADCPHYRRVTSAVRDLCVCVCSGMFKKRSAGKPDGCAIFWKSSKFMRRSAFSMEYNDLARKYQNPVFSTNNVACGVLLAPTANALAGHSMKASSEAASAALSRHFWIVNTHVYWDPKVPFVKLAQTIMLKERLHELTKDSHLPVILCGDFNATPNSLPYQYLNVGSDADLRKDELLQLLQPAVAPAGSGSQAVITAAASDAPARQSLDGTENKSGEGTAPSLLPSTAAPFLRSVRYGQEPEVTNHTPDFRDTLDYICVSRDAFVVQQHNTLPTAAQLQHVAGLPNEEWPSDHLALCADVLWVDESAEPGKRHVSAL